MRILVVTSVFPNGKQPALGVFVRERMFKVAGRCELKVVAPVPWFPFARFLRKGYRPSVPYREIQDGIEVYHPRFFNVPGFFKCLDGVFFFLSSLVTLFKIKKDFDFDLIDSHFAYPDGLGAVLLGKAFNRPVTVTVRGTLRKLARYRLRRAQIRYALDGAAKVFTVCEDLKRAVTELGIDGLKVEVVPNGVDADKFRPMDKAAARVELGLPPDRPILISVGGLVERKGFHRVIEVLPELKKAVPGLLYVIIGGASVEGDYEPVLRGMVRDAGLEDDVLFAGSRPHDLLYRWLSAADLFCLATSNEGWANVFLEAMACGLPVVTTRVGGNEEVVASDEYGILFNLDDRREMTAALVAALQKKWDRDAIMGYAMNNTWDKRVEQLLGLFSGIVGSAMPENSAG